MTAQQTGEVRIPPRSLIRTFWMLHRALYRLSGGRFGLTRPEAGQKFGTMRLHTVGRRSARSRIAIVGYYEDGPNLVTLAMNGWADAEPAWWLNLQAEPDATVDLADGPRTVRSRAATGEDRQRLWARFRDFPGWGDDIDALAARRSMATAVVVLEPHSGRMARRGARRAGHDRRTMVRSGALEQILEDGQVGGDRSPDAFGR